ncbi:MAG: glucosaminidase domain-containing protein [Oligoflexia bacterium]|nr:glucosaminidase domain-containing protein [Oligoflexia bacterium]
MFFYSIAYADPTEVWDTSQTQKFIDSKKTIQALKAQADCNTYQSPSDVLNLFEILNSEEAVQALVDPYKKKFLCQVDNYISEQNKEVMEDQKFMLSYLDNNDQRTEADHLRMTELLIKYRLLRDKNWKEYFVSATRFQPPEETKRQISQLAKLYIKEFGNPTHCFFVKSSKAQKSSLEDKACRDEISLKARPIPAPLVLTQSVLESDWGNSSLAKEESNILGLQVKFRNPSTMSNYPHCRPAKKAPSRCLLKFDNYRGSIYEYFSRFNGSHLSGYSKYREARKDIYDNSDWDSCKKAAHLSNAVDFYAENPNYVAEIQSMIDAEICEMVSTACLEGSALTAKR